MNSLIFTDKCFAVRNCSLGSTFACLDRQLAGFSLSESFLKDSSISTTVVFLSGDNDIILEATLASSNCKSKFLLRYLLYEDNPSIKCLIFSVSSKIFLMTKMQHYTNRCSICGKKLKLKFDRITENPLACWAYLIVGVVDS